jgi:hypothetical protein
MCPTIPPAQMAAYAHPAFPDQIVVRVPALQPGGRFEHRLSYWDQLCWPEGRYRISAKADAENSESEGNVGEANNYVEALFVNYRGCAGVPRPPFDPSKPPHATPVPAMPAIKPAIPVAPVDPSKPPQATPVPAVPQPIGKQPAK